MKFKLKFEIVYENIDKDILRDMKIQSVLDDIVTEVISDSPISTPNKEDIIILKGTEYVIRGISHIIDSDSYTTLIKIENKKLIERAKKIEEEEQLKRMVEMLKYEFK